MYEILPMFKKCKKEALNTSNRKNQDSNIKKIVKITWNSDEKKVV